jgi:site-specific recombinase XerD
MSRTGTLSIKATQQIPCQPAPPQDRFETESGSRASHPNQPAFLSPRLAEFVEHSFIPEFVARKRSAGREYFRAILKHVLPPEQVARLFAANGKVKDKLKTVPGWPYIDSLRLCEVDPQSIQRLTSAALERGYSIQTATHIRNVVRSIFSHAIRRGFYRGTNPAMLVGLPPVTRKEAHSVTLAQLEDLFRVMIYPEREVVLLAMLTDMTIPEICGLRWKHLNTSSVSRLMGQEFIPPTTIAVRSQNFRGELSAVIGNRQRFLRIPRLLSSYLHELKRRRHFTTPDDFVLVSRNGTPIHPENIAARRLKPIGYLCDMPWLSWSVFYRTRANLQTEFGKSLHCELEKIIALPKLATTSAAESTAGKPMSDNN